MSIFSLTRQPVQPEQGILRQDLNVISPGHAVIRKIIAGSNIEISYTGIDPGTGDVTISYVPSSSSPNPNVVLFNNTGSGNSSGASYNGSQSITVSYNTIGAQGQSPILTALTNLVYSGGTPFVKMTGANTFALDTTTYLTANQTITLSGDITGSGNTALSTVISNNVVTLAKLAQVSTSTILGRVTGGTGNVESLTATQATALLDLFSTTAKGLVPVSTGGTTNFLRADGTWAAPSGGGGGSSGTTTNPVTFNNSGSGNSSGITFDGSSAVTISYNTIGAQQASSVLSGLAALSWTSGTPFVKMTGAGTFSLDTATYYLASNPSGYTNNTGTVTSVAIALPGIFGLTGSPITTSGTFTVTLASQTANTVFIAPNGSAGVPTFRALLLADLPSLSTTNVSEGTNLYYTDTRARAALSFVAGSGAYNSSTGVITIPTNTSQLVNGAGYITGNQTITLTGNVTGSGTTSIVTTIANGVVTNAMLVNSSFNIGTTSISLGRASAAQTLTGVSIDGNSGTVTDGVYTTGSYANPAWITSLGWSKITGAPAFLTAESDTLATVTGRGATTSTPIVLQGSLAAWNATTPGTANGGLHLGAASVTTDFGPAITFGARDSSSGTTAQAGIYVISGGNFGTIMYIATTDAYVSGSKTAISISNGGVVNFVRSRPTALGNTIWDSGNLTNLNQLTNGPGYITSSASITGAAARLTSRDIRTIAPNSESASELRFGFTSWANNNTAPYADFLHLRSYLDGSGGNDNLVLFRKDAIGMRIYQQSFGSATAYSNFVDVLHSANYNSYSPTLTGTGASGTWSINITGNAATATSADNIDGWSFVNTGSNSATAADSINSNGISYVGTNISLFGQSDGALFSQAYSSVWQHQIYGDYRTGQIAIRGKNNGTWQSWRTVLDSGNYSSYALPLSGGTMGGHINMGAWNITNITTLEAVTLNLSGTATVGAISTPIILGTGGSYIQSTSTGIAYTQNWQIRENSGGSGNTNVIYAPQLGFHWGGVVASSILLESSGRVSVRDNPGTSYEKFIAGATTVVGYNDSIYLNVNYNNTSTVFTVSASGTSVSAHGILDLYKGGTSNIQLNANNTSNSYINAGNFGIGTTSPQSILDVVTPTNGYASFASLMGVGNWSGIHFGYRENNTLYRKSAIVFERTDNSGGGGNAAGKVHILNGPSTGAASATLSDAKLTIGELGNVGIGTTSPATKLNVQGNGVKLRLSTESDPSIYYFDIESRYDSGNTINFYGTAGNNFLRYIYNNNGLILQPSAGNVGIGTASPAYKLEIVGDQKITSGALGVNVNPNATDGRIDASNDIVAYSSDMRLKTNIKKISNPLEKVKSLTGFIYNWNDRANKLAGFDVVVKHVGVYAQEVQSILPEAVKLAPFDNDGYDNSISGQNYLTVQYEKIVPLLIEAIKEQQTIIEELKIKVYGTTS